MCWKAEHSRLLANHWRDAQHDLRPSSSRRENCDRFLEAIVKSGAAKFIEIDEQWDFIRAKAKTALKRNLGEGTGDTWSWSAIDADTKLILSHTVGMRDEPTCRTSLTQLNNATTGHTQVTTDGLALYTHGVRCGLESTGWSRTRTKRLAHLWNVNRGPIIRLPTIIGLGSGSQGIH